jgi:predicted component of type VI protein secretion system
MSTFLLKLGDMRFPLRLGETLLGRSPYCSIVLSDTRCSREHAAIRVTAAGPTIQDLGSRNGTRVNGELLTGVKQLVPGDRIDIGSQRIELEVTGQPSARRHPLSVTHDCPAPVPEEETPTAPGTSRRGHVVTDSLGLAPPK